MKELRSIGVFILILFLIFVGFRTCLKKVPLGSVGVRSNLLRGGIEPRDLPPGYHVVIPGMHRLQLMDSRTRMMTMGPASAGVGPAFQLIAKDQFPVGLDVSIAYSLEKGMAHNALQRYGEGDAFVEKMRLRAEKVLTEILGQLTTEEFFAPEKRTRQAELALSEMNRSMQDESTREYLTVYFLLIRNVSYDEGFEKRILEKQLSDQQKLVFESKAKTEAELEKTQIIGKQTQAKTLAIQEEQKQQIATLGAQTDAEIARIEAEAQFYGDTIRAEADRYMREKTALGELEKTLATAKGDKAVNAAYAGPGGQLLLAKKMIQNVALGEIEINTNRTNPFDVSEMLNMLGVGPSLLEPSEAPAAAAAGAPSALEAIRARVAQDEAKAKQAGPRGAELLERLAPTPNLAPATPSEALPPASLPASAPAESAKRGPRN